ncbi:TIGR01621 family pseudouridine synthase, partial [Psychrosphaera sp.]|nr:TIGR01621 family pseudouridine synthase [Psychrosphaera sp.]
MKTELKIDVAFTHSDFYIVIKPANINFHDEGEVGQGFFNRCVKHFNEELFPVHRLDKVTSGLLILARNNRAAIWFQKAFSERTINKYYLAVSNMKPKKKQGAIIGDMEKARRSQWKLVKTKHNPAVTRFFSFTNPESIGVRLYLLKPESGKTHQLRVALKSLSAPILGDQLYGGEVSDRVYLHSARLDFNYG